MRIAIFGGSFNPIHNGHLELADLVCKERGYDRILFVPAACSPFKKKERVASSKHRLAMLELALFNSAWAMIDKCELQRNEQISYTIDSIFYLQKKYQYCERFGLIIGLDQANLFMKWRQAEMLLELVDLIIVEREGVAANLPPLLAAVQPLTFYNPCSSLQLRNQLLSGGDVSRQIPSTVLEYIYQNRLYSIDANDRGYIFNFVS